VVTTDPVGPLCGGNEGLVSIFLNKGNGKFDARQDYMPSGCFPNSVAIGDFNHDGKLDLAVLDQLTFSGETPGRVDIFLGNGDGTFQSGHGYSTQTDPWKLVAADFNGDGNLDLAICNLSYQPPVSLFLGNGDGTFQTRVDLGNPDSLEAESIVAADFNHDGKLDLAVGDGDVHVFLGNGDGSFQPQIDVQYFGLFGALAVGDVNGNGVLDLVGNGLSILLGDGDGSFQPGYLYDWPGFRTTLVDLNHDGKLDVL
jgi:hypothetical protein